MVYLASRTLFKEMDRTLSIYNLYLSRITEKQHLSRNFISRRLQQKQLYRDIKSLQMKFCRIATLLLPRDNYEHGEISYFCDTELFHPLPPLPAHTPSAGKAQIGAGFFYI